MNLLLLFDDDFVDDHRVALGPGRRLRHVCDVIRPAVGETIKVGRLGGMIGAGAVVARSSDELVLDVAFEREPPSPLAVTLLLALPRPKSLFRLLQLVTTMGVKEIHLFNCSRVDKSYWGSGRLQPEAMRTGLIAGLEQAVDTVLPTVTLHRLFVPFVRDELPGLLEPISRRLVAHPSDDATPYPRELDGPTALAVGPERGFIDYEIGRLRDLDFEVVQLGRRVLRVEHALAALLGRFCG